MTPEQEIIEKVKLIFDRHKTKLNNLKENRSKWEEQKWTDADVSSADEQIKLLAEILSDLNKQVLFKRNQEWWRGKTLEQLPEYIKSKSGKIFKVIWKIEMEQYLLKEDSVHTHYYFPISIDVKPATEQDYQQYLNQKFLKPETNKEEFELVSVGEETIKLEIQQEQPTEHPQLCSHRTVDRVLNNRGTYYCNACGKQFN